ncbi:MAG: hypothetical protein VYE46_03925 [Cyanobacteriota bacterium]|nr:hypothetical protein [Cyanobacteriota bacterium]
MCLRTLSDYRPSFRSREQKEFQKTSVRNNGGILKRGAMVIAVGPHCPLHLSVLNSPDY